MSEVAPPTDAFLAEAARKGDVEAFGLLVERYQNRLIGLAFHLCGDYETSRDLAQEALLAAFDSLDRLRDPASFGFWLSGILRNKYRNLGRKTFREQTSLDELMEAGFDAPAPEFKEEFDKDEVRQVLKMVQSLPEKYREVLILRYSREQSYKEIAEFLGLPATTVTTRLTYGRKLLMEKAREAGMI